MNLEDNCQTYPRNRAISQLIGRRSSWVALAAALLVAVSCRSGDLTPTETAESAPATLHLEVDAPIEQRLPVGATHEYSLALPAAHYLRLAIDSQFVDLELSLVGPDNESLGDLLVPEWGWRPETLSIGTRSAGSHRLDIRSVSSSDASLGVYRLSIVELRPRTDADTVRLEAEGGIARALRASELQTREGNEEAASALRRSLRLWTELEEKLQAAETLVRLGMVLTDLDSHEEAATGLRQAASIAAELADHACEADGLYRLGIVYRQQGQHAKALVFFQRALRIYSEAGEREPQALALINLGYAYHKLEDLQKALDQYRQALGILRELGQRDSEAQVLNNLATNYQALGDLEEADERFAETLALARGLGNRALEAATLNNIGWGLKERGAPGESLRYFDDALKIAKELESARKRSTYYDNKGRAQLALGALDEARELCRAAYELSVSLGDKRGQAVRLISLSLVHQALEQPRSARAHFEKALGISRGLHDRRNEAETLYYLSALHRAQGELEAARNRIGEAITIVEGVRSGVGSQSLKASYLAAQRRYFELQVDLLVDLASAEPSDRQALVTAAFEAHERWRARSLFETLAEALAEIRTDPELLSREEALLAEINTVELGRQNPGHGGDSQAGTLKIRRLFEELTQVETQIRASNPALTAINRFRPLKLGEIQQRVLDDDSLLLEYALGEERSHLFAITVDSIEHFELQGRAELETEVRHFLKLIRSAADENGGEGSAVSGAARELGRSLVGPVGHSAVGKRLLLATEGALQYLPFSALRPAGGKRPLLVDHEIVNLPSASVLAIQRQRLKGRAVAPLTLAVLADPVFAPWDRRLRALRDDARNSPMVSRAVLLRSAAQTNGRPYERLAGTQREAEEIGALVEESSRLLALGFDATRATALSPEMSRYRILHFATHGFLNNRNPELSGLVLSLFDRRGEPRDGFLRMHDIYRLRLNADLVVLSACRTGLGKEIRGEGLIGITRGFMNAGAARIVASLWQVDDQATAELMRRFYGGMLGRGQEPAAALRAAQLALLRGEAGERNRAAFYWAAFVLQGEWQRQPIAGRGEPRTQETSSTMGE